MAKSKTSTVPISRSRSNQQTRKVKESSGDTKSDSSVLAEAKGHEVKQEEVIPTQVQPSQQAKGKSEIKDLILSDITVDESLQMRAEKSDEVIEEYQEAWSLNAKFPPLNVVRVDGRNLLVDGYHRYTAAIKAKGKSETVSCEVIEGTMEDALLAAVRANSNHGMRRTNEDKRRAVLAIIKHPKWVRASARAVAEICVVTDKLVTKVRNESPTSEDPKSDDKIVIDKNGREMNVQNIGVKNKKAVANGQNLNPSAPNDSPPEDGQIGTSLPTTPGVNSTVVQESLGAASKNSETDMPPALPDVFTDPDQNLMEQIDKTAKELMSLIYKARTNHGYRLMKDPRRWISLNDLASVIGPIHEYHTYDKIKAYLACQSEPKSADEICEAFPWEKAQKIKSDIQTLQHTSKVLDHFGKGGIGDPFRYKLKNDRDIFQWLSIGAIAAEKGGASLTESQDHKAAARPEEHEASNATSLAAEGTTSDSGSNLFTSSGESYGTN